MRNANGVDLDKLTAIIKENLQGLRMQGDSGTRLSRALACVASPLAAGVLPFASQIQVALDACAMVCAGGKALRCDKIAQRAWNQIGPTVAKDLVALSRGAEIATGSDLQKVASVAECVLAQLLTQKDIDSGRIAKVHVAARVRVGDAAIAKDAFEKGSELFTDDELEKTYQALLKSFNEWNGDECNMGRLCKHFKELESKLHAVVALLKRSRGEAMAGQRRK